MDIFLFFISTQSFRNLLSTGYSWGLRNVELGKHNGPTWECKKILLLQKKLYLTCLHEQQGKRFTALLDYPKEGRFVFILMYFSGETCDLALATK